MQLYAKKVGVSAAVLQQTLWGDFYLDTKTKSVKKGAQVSLIKCWHNIYYITLHYIEIFNMA